MVKVLVIRYTESGRLKPSDITPEKKEEIVGKVQDFLKANPDVKFNGMYANDDGIGICDWEAPDAETVKKAVDAVGAPYDAVVAVEKVMP